MRPALRIYLILAAPLLFVGFLCPYSRAQDQPKRPRITGIDHVRLYVSDLNESRAFYERKFGLPRVTGHCGGSVRSCLGWVQGGSGQRIELEQMPQQPPKDLLAEVGFATN